ncbi:response regulator [Deminuibacter soli]|uniref:Response regulator n=1 Tax=Deminuibacter soli TaxID=2291815 RepID=A0A3E1NF73_9BACT|nr:response regulator [Deminuibacter soli]RFM26527.1 response regulator [Deminuibacter soli]
MAKFKTVLLVEDDPITVMVCERIIRMTGFAEQVKSVTNGQEAMDLIHEQAKHNAEELPQLIFLDINMPVMNGWEFLARFNSISGFFPRQPDIYVLSSTVDPEDYKRAESYSVVKRFISKPLTTELLNNITA